MSGEEEKWRESTKLTKREEKGKTRTADEREKQLEQQRKRHGGGERETEREEMRK